MNGTSDVIVAGGAEHEPDSHRLGDNRGPTNGLCGSVFRLDGVAETRTQEVSQFRSADMIAEKWGISREDMERFALTSHRRAIRATDEGRFARGRRDRCLRRRDRTRGWPRDTWRMATFEDLGKSRPHHRGGVEQISDAAAARC